MARIPFSVAIGEIQQSFRDVWSTLAPLAEATPFDWKKRRLINLADAVSKTDAVTKQQLDAVRALVTGINEEDQPTTGALSVGSGKVRRGAFSTRGAASSHAGEWFLASDHNNVTWYSTGAAWVYVAGVMYGTLSPDLKPTGLGTNDANYRFRSTDFLREYRWTGSAWEDAPGQPARGTIAYFTDGLLPGTGLSLCNATAGVTRSTPTGGTTTFTTPDLTASNRFIRSVATTTGGTCGAAMTHTHQVDPPSTTSGAPNINTTSGAGATTEVQAGSGTVVASSTHTHLMESHTHATDIAAFASAGPSGTGGDAALPPYLNLRPYIRL